MSVAIEPGGELDSPQSVESLTGARTVPDSVARGEEQPAPYGDTKSAEAVKSGRAPAEVAVHRHGLLQASQSLGYVVIVALFIITFTLQPFRIPSASMEPTLLVGDFLLVDKQVGPEASPHIFPSTGVINRGDMIVFHYPVNSSMHLVKRVIGLPGDRLRLRGGHVYIDGNAILEPYAVYRPSAPDSYRDEFPRLVSADPSVNSRWWIEMHALVSQGELTVPPDRYFVLGDNRNDSEDSRYWGFVPRAAIVGKPLLVYFSLNDSVSAAGQASANAMPGSAVARPQRSRGSVSDFARWKRAFHIVN